MINRVLIRIKVVQLLYSYLLADDTFSLESQPTAPTKEKRFAYALYLDLMVLMARIAENIRKRGGEQPLADTRFIRRLMADDKIKSLMERYRREGFPLESVVDTLTEAVKESGIYKNFLKAERRNEGVWEEIFNIIIAPDPALGALVSQRLNHTLRGVDRMREMMATTFTNFFAAQDSVAMALKTLSRSLDQARELYFRMLVLPVELTMLRERQLEERREKYIVSEEDLNPNMRFVDNDLVRRIADNERVRKYCEDHKISWLNEDPHLLRELLKEIMASEVYKDYMEAPATDMRMDCELWRNLFRYVIFDSPTFLESLEDKSVFWNDDVDIIGTFLLKTLKRFASEEGGEPVMEMYKDDEDARFGAELFTAVVRNREYYRGLIDASLDNRKWEAERLAYMDVVVVMTALAEIMNFPKIPLNVSVNEYVEMAKAYSTPRSGSFVHGLIATITRNLCEEGKLLK
ncbi:MAG: hypothetical protein K2O24_09690 [Muribaculaceae bacterium]|nr:hypothetical protein [Muribaculaceae bacterium]